MHPQYRFISLHCPLSYLRTTYINTQFIILSEVEGRFTTFQQYAVCRPIFFQRLLLRTAIGVGSLHNLQLITVLLYRRLYFFITYIFIGRYALNQGTPFGCLIFFPRRYTLISATFRSVPTLNSRVYGGCSIAATPPLRSSYIPL